jgi:hypothetical protein
MTVGRTRVACWIPKATNIQSEYGILTAFPLPELLQVRDSVLGYTCISCVGLANTDLRTVLHHEKLHIIHFSPAFVEIIK